MSLPSYENGQSGSSGIITDVKQSRQELRVQSEHEPASQVTRVILKSPVTSGSMESSFSDSFLASNSYSQGTRYDDHSRPLLSTTEDDDQETVQDSSYANQNPRRNFYSRFTTSSFRRSLKDFYDLNYGAMLVLASQFFGSVMNLSARLLETPGSHGEPMHPIQILLVRQLITTILCTTYALTTRSIPDFPLGPRKVRLLLMCRGLTGFFGIIGMYMSLLYMPLSEATVLTFLSPILTGYACSFFIPGEVFTRKQQIAGLVSLIGVLFIARPFKFMNGSYSEPANETPVSDPADGGMGALNSTMLAAAMSIAGNSSGSTTEKPSYPSPTPSQHLFSFCLGLMGILGATGAMTSIRAIGTRAHPFVSINYFSVFCTIVSLAGILILPSVQFRLPGSLIEWGLLLTLGLCGFIMQSLLTRGLGYGGPSDKEVKRSSAENASTTDAQPTDVVSTAAIGKQPDIELGSLNTSTASSSQVPMLTRSLSAVSVTSTKPKPSGTRATSMVYMQMLFALSFDRLVFGVVPGAMSWIGSGLILAGALAVAAGKEEGGSRNVAASAIDSTSSTTDISRDELEDTHRDRFVIETDDEDEEEEESILSPSDDERRSIVRR